MNGTSSSVIAIGVAAGTINTIHAAITKGNASLFKVGAASFLVIGGFLAIGAWNPDLAVMMAVLYCISSVMLNGEWVLKLAASLVGGST